MTLSSPVGDWARDKYWLIDHTLVLPSEKEKAFLFTKNVNASRLDFYQRATYYAKGEDIPLVLPAKFSIKLGDGPNASAPFAYVASSALPNLSSFQYDGVVFPLLDEPK